MHECVRLVLRTGCKPKGPQLNCCDATVVDSRGLQEKGPGETYIHRLSFDKHVLGPPVNLIRFLVTP